MIYKYIHRDDVKFFPALGFLSGMFMNLFSLLPERINRGVFSEIFNDHIAVASIYTLIFVQLFLGAIWHLVKNGKVKSTIESINTHLCFRVKSFASPAISMLIGLAVFCLGLAFFSSKYLGYSYVFMMFALILFILIVISTEILGKFTEFSKVKEWVLIFSFSSILLILYDLFFNAEDIQVNVKLTIAEFDLVQSGAEVENVSIEEVLKQGGVDRAIDINKSVNKK